MKIEPHESKQTVIECDCGSHMLKVQSEVDYYSNLVLSKTRFNQEFYLAMFYYGIHTHKRNIWGRIVIAWKYLRSGKMFSDQLCLTPEEAKKLADFINENVVEAEPSCK